MGGERNATCELEVIVMLMMRLAVVNGLRKGGGGGGCFAMVIGACSG